MFFLAARFETTFWDDFWSDSGGSETVKMRFSCERGCKNHIFTEDGFLSILSVPGTILRSFWKSKSPRQSVGVGGGWWVVHEEFPVSLRMLA